MSLTYGDVLKRALVAGLLAGVLVAAYLVTVVEPSIDQAISIEEAASKADHHGHTDAPLFTRPEQVRGGALASVIYGVLVALVFGTIYAAIRHRLHGRSELMRVVQLAAVAFATTALLPALKYPANPPAVGDPDTVNERTTQYLLFIVFCVVGAVVLAKISGRLRSRIDDASRIVAVTILTVVLYGAAILVFPDSPDKIPRSFPAQLIWDFRIESLGGLALLWLVLGLGLGWAMQRRATAADRGLPLPVDG
jgi:predicted cobalt transporter CbtA